MKNRVSNCAQSFCIIIASIFLTHAAAQADGDEDKFKMSGGFRLRGEFDTSRDGDRPD